MIRSVALRARGFSESSSSEAVMGLRFTGFTVATLPHTHTGNDGGQTQGLASERKVFLTVLSSSE